MSTTKCPTCKSRYPADNGFKKCAACMNLMDKLGVKEFDHLIRIIRQVAYKPDSYAHVDFTAKQVKELCERTGSGMGDCRTALIRCDGNMEDAETWIRVKGIC